MQPNQAQVVFLKRKYFVERLCASLIQNMLLKNVLNLGNRSPSMEWLQFCSFHFPRLYEGISEQLALHFKVISHCWSDCKKAAMATGLVQLHFSPHKGNSFHALL